MKLALGIALAALVAQDVKPREETNDQRRARMTEECTHTTRFRLKELEHYFLVTDVTDRNVIEELEDRVEATRRAVSLFLDPPPAGEGSPGPSVRNPNDPPSKSVLRVHAKHDMYLASGGIEGTNGLYFPERTEILLFSGIQTEGRAELFRMAQSLVTCEMFDRVLGDRPHAPWFQCGLQDYFAGFGFRNSTLERKPHAARLAKIRDIVAMDEYAPLKTLCAMNRAQYFGNNEFKLGADVVWAQGWSLVWFLMTAEKTTYRGRDILDRYLIRWKHDHDVDAAIAFAFEGVDWDVLEREWRACVEKIR